MEDNEIENPLFAPCKCAGSMRLIHHGCLKTWFAAKRIMKVSNIVTTYFWKNLECELCKTAYPYEVRSLDGRKMLNIIEYDTP
jgi:E3 ubiquitin-protein ligase DOA10